MKTYAIAPTNTTGLALNTVADCANWRVNRWCPARNYIKNPSLEYGLTGWAARTPGGGNQISPRTGIVYTGAHSGYAFSTGAATPGVTYDLTYLISGNQGKTFTLSVAVNPEEAQVLTLNVIAAVGTDRVIATVTRDVVCGWERLEVVFPIPTNTDFAATLTALKFEITTGVNSPFYFDSAMVLEGAKRNFLYFDGDEHGEWIGTPSSSYSDSLETEPNGEMVDLRDVGFTVTSYSGLGLPASEHIGTDTALRGGKSYDRTLQRARQFSITGRIYSAGSVNDIHSSRAKLIELFKPQSADLQAHDVLIEYQPCDCDGVMCCRRRVRVKFVDDGLAGNIDGAGSELVTLRFEEAAPPTVTEEAGNSQALEFSKTLTLDNIIGYTRETGWIDPVVSGASSSTQILAVATTDLGTWLVGNFATSGVRFVGIDGVMSTPSGVLANTLATAVAVAPNGEVWISGTTAGNYLYRRNSSGAVNNVSSAFNSFINKILFHPNGHVYAMGNFTAPAHMAISQDYGNTWIVPAGTGVNGNIEDGVVLPDGRVLVVGDFTLAGGVACKNAAIYNPNSNTFQALATSTDGRILACAVGLDGRVYLGGEFTNINGILCSRIAAWNGTQVSGMALGVSGGSGPAVFTIAINPCNGELWVGGVFSLAGGFAANNMAVWNGSTWTLPDVQFAAGTYVLSSTFDRNCNYIAGLVGGYGATATTSSQTAFCYNGSADERPVFTFTGPGRLRNIRNITTGATIYINYTMQFGEVCTLDLTRGARHIFQSSYYGPKPGAVFRGSDLDRFALKTSNKSDTCVECPNNTISAFISDGVPGPTTAIMTYQNRHWGIDAECGSPRPRREGSTGGIAFTFTKTINGSLNGCNGLLAGQPITIYDDQGNLVNVTTNGSGAFSVTLPFPANVTFVTAVFNPTANYLWSGVASYAQIRVLRTDPSTLNFPNFLPIPCCALVLKLSLTTPAGAPVITSAATVTVSSSGGGTPISLTNVATNAPGVIIVYQATPTLLPGTLTATVSAPGYATQVGTGTFSTCNSVDITINTFGPASTTVGGTLLDCNGAPINGATIRITHIDGLFPQQDVTTNASGVFTKTYAFSPGVLIATAIAFPGYTSASTIESRFVLQTPGVAFTFPPFTTRPCPNTLTLTGVLTDCYNTELQSKTITIRDSGGKTVTATTNSIGAFSFAGSFAVGIVTASFVDAANYSSGTALSSVVYAGGNVTLAFPAFSPLPCCPNTVSGTVTDTGGAPVYGANVSITDALGVVRTATTSTSGSWGITAPFAVGPYTAVVGATGYGNTQTASGSFAKCTAYTINFAGVLTPFVSQVLGQVADCNGNDVAFASVTITDSIGRQYTAQTNGNGLFQANHTYSLGLIRVSVTSLSYGTQVSIGTGTLNAYGGSVFISTYSPLLCNAPVTGFGLLASGLRDKLKWPFASNSIWNQPIGASATLAAAGITFGVHTDPGGINYQTRFIEEEEILFMDSAAPLVTVNYSPAEWTGADRCVASGSAGGFPFTARMPASYIIPNDGNNNSTAWIDSTGNTVLQAQPTARCTSGGSATAFVKFADENIYADGENGAHGGSNLSALGGTIRYGEWTYVKNNNLTYFRHALKLNMMAKKWYYWGGGGGNQFRWPATTADNYANGTTYGGTNSQLKPGSLLVLASSFNVAALLTQPGRIIAETLKRFGAYLVDDTSWNACAVAIERGPLGNVKDEFQTLWGYAWRQQPDTTPQQTDWYKDWITIAAALQVVTNNGPSAIGGGGSITYTTPPAPAIGN